MDKIKPVVVKCKSPSSTTDPDKEFEKFQHRVLNELLVTITESNVKAIEHNDEDKERCLQLSKTLTEVLN